jgi:two-component system, NtrC family, sensor kinase
MVVPAAVNTVTLLPMKFKPAFWNRRPQVEGKSKYLFNYRRIWKLSVLLTGIVVLVPLIFITLVGYQVTEHDMEVEFRLRTARIVSNTRRTIDFFLSERRSALEFIVNDNTFEALNNPKRLGAILRGLRKSFGGGFMDLGVIEGEGVQKTYVGPFTLRDKDYHVQPWFKQVVDQGVYISDVFLGYRQVPHLVIAVKQSRPNGEFHVLRASLGIQLFENLLAGLELSGQGDAFIINHQGVLQTNARYHGKVLAALDLPIPEFNDSTEVVEALNKNGEKLFVGYRFIEGTPFILMIVKNRDELMQSWRQTRMRLILFLVSSVTIIVAVILGTVTYMVSKIHIADEKRLMTLHQMEYSAKMASIGRMAANVAHEINNPLAIINEKAGLIQDLFTFKKQYADDTKLAGLVASILTSVKRAGKITKRLLAFARNLEGTIETVRLEQVIREVLSFLEKEAEYSNIQIHMDAAPDTPAIESDRGKLQQIFLNIINNAFAAMNSGGRLDIRVWPDTADLVKVRISDNGCGISEEDQRNIFEPFFSTKISRGGTGLGLSITYNLTREIGGDIHVQSQIDQGTSFTVSLPLNSNNPPKENTHAHTAGR